MSKNRKGNGTKTFEQKKINRLKNQWTDNAIDLVGYAFLLALRDGENYGKARMQRVQKRVCEICQSMYESRLTVKDIKETLEKEVGVNMDGVKKGSYE